MLLRPPSSERFTIFHWRLTGMRSWWWTVDVRGCVWLTSAAGRVGAESDAGN